MRTIVLGALAASLATTPPAAGYDTAPNGVLCGATEVPNPEPGAPSDDRVVEIDAGPATTDVPGTLVCTLQARASTHAGADTVVREFSAVDGVIAGVATVRFSWPTDAHVYLCSSFRGTDGSTRYFSRGARWHTDPGMPCPPVFQPVAESADHPAGLLCGFTAVEDPDPTHPDDMTGEIDAGPAVTGVPGTLVCTVQVDADTHAGPDAVTREFASGAKGVIAGVQPASYRSPEDAWDTVMCTSFRKADGSGTLYWTSGPHAHWHTDPRMPCSAGTQSGTQPLWESIDDMVCPLLEARNYPGPPVTFDPTYVDEEGDVFVDTGLDGFSEATAMTELFYDCPVYAFGFYGDNPDRDDPANPGVIDW